MTITAKELAEMTSEARSDQFQSMSPGDLWELAHDAEFVTQAPSHVLVSLLDHVTDRWYRPNRWATSYTSKGRPDHGPRFDVPSSDLE